MFSTNREQEQKNTSLVISDRITILQKRTPPPSPFYFYYAFQRNLKSSAWKENKMTIQRHLQKNIFPAWTFFNFRGSPKVQFFGKWGDYDLVFTPTSSSAPFQPANQGFSARVSGSSPLAAIRKTSPSARSLARSVLEKSLKCGRGPPNPGRNRRDPPSL